MTMTAPSRPARAVQVARLGWIVMTLVLMAIFIAGLQPRYHELTTICQTEPCIPLTFTETDVAALVSLGISLETYARWHVAIELFASAMIVTLALLIFWRRPNDWMAILVAYALSLFGLNFMVESDLAFIRLYPALLAPFDYITSLAGVLFGLIFFLFPDGRFVPGWTRWVAAVLVAVGLTDPIWRALGLTIPSGQFSFVLLNILLIAMLVGVMAQVYRYRYVSTSTQRQQSKWAILGLVSMVVPITAWAYFIEIAPLLPGIARVRFNVYAIAVLLPFFLFMPLTFVISILRYRLWDIDLVLRRTLQYALLTGLLALVYFSAVVVLQNLFVWFTGQRSQVVIVISTLAIATLFTPLRRRVQNTIDRRFFRNKYDAEQSLANFAAIAREQVDIENLTGTLVNVIEETVQPEHASIWLKTTSKQEFKRLSTQRS